MKKFLLIFIVLQLSLYGYAQSPTAGQLKVTIVSFKCINQSWDGLIEFDGHGNEVSVNFSYRIYSPANPGAARSGADGTVIYGSNVNGMTRAGTQTPDLGGIKNGDVVNIFKPIMDEHINADEFIIIAPNVWEWDGPEKNTINAFNAQLERDLDFVITQPFPFANVAVGYNDLVTPIASRVIKVFDKYPYGQALKYQSIFSPILCNGNTQGNRVMGLVSGGAGAACQVAFAPTLLVLDTKALYGLYVNNQSSTTTGTSHAEKESKTYWVDGVTVTFTETTYAIATSNGSYSVFLKIEFTPDATAPAQTSPKWSISRPAKTVNIIKQDLPDRTIKAANIIAFVSGTWAGTQTNDYGLYPNNIRFELTGNGEYLMKDNNGVLAAKGNYSISGNNFSGSYKLFGDGSTYSFIGTYDPNTQIISCTQGSGTATTGMGKWTATKK